MLLFTILCAVLFTAHSCLRANAESSSYVDMNTKTEGVNFLTSTAYEVPHDVPTAADSTQTALSIFAWQEFIALNWPSTYSKDGKRGNPDISAGVKGFLEASNKGELVWHTYKHRVEVFPKMDSVGFPIKFDSVFDSRPKYQYAQNIQGLNSSQKLSEVTIFNNLDETSEINLCTLFVDGDPNEPGASNYNDPGIASGLPGAPRRMIYEAKVNRAMFDYVKDNKLYDPVTRTKRIAFTDNAIKNDEKGAVYLTKEQLKNSDQIVFPFGEIGGSEGSIEIKATWRQLTLSEYNSKRYLTAPIIRYRGGTPQSPNPDPKTAQAYYDTVAAKPTANSLPYGLVGLHIIHKTKTFPSYVFATFEQVDNLSTDHESLNNLYYYNRQQNPFISSGKQNVYTRSNPILHKTDSINTVVHNQIKSMHSGSVWQYYKLIGVQGHPVQNDNTTDYYLSNIATETNAVLANFSGTLDKTTGTKDPKGINVYQGKNKIVQGGCKGCHGNAQDADFSFITKDAPINMVDFINQPLLANEQ